MSKNAYVCKIKKDPTKEGYKVCIKCGEEKSFANFKPLKGGRFGVHSWCIPCLKNYQNSRPKKPYIPKPKREPSQGLPVALKYPRLPKVPDTHKKCSGCNEVKEITPENFQRNAAGKGGWNSRCKICTTAKYHAKKKLVELDKRVRANRIALGLPLKGKERKPAYRSCKKCLKSFPAAEFAHSSGKCAYKYCVECRKTTGYQKVLVRKKLGRYPSLKIGDLHMCRRCNISKSFTYEFFSPDSSKTLGLSYRCRECKNVDTKEYYKKHPEKRSTYNPVLRKAWREKHKNDPIYKLKKNLNRSFSQAIKSKGHIKECRTVKVLGCSFEDLKKHLEYQFTEGMSWDNYGKGPDKWNIDHHYPQSKAKTVEEVIKLNHYTNLRPMWHLENIAKHDHIPENWNPLEK